jgi:succinate dehydrogenase/fumarate reductase flavoprotein subunit
MKENIHIIESDILIIGSGIAGLSAAMAASNSGKKVLVVSKSAAGKATNTTLAGGLFTCATDRFPIKAHFNKTLKSGRMLNNPALVKQFVEAAPSKVKALMGIGLKGYYHQSGFHCRTTKFIGGPHLSSVLVNACRKSGVRFIDAIQITDLITEDGICRGTVGFHKKTGQFYAFSSKSVILTLGGAGAIYGQTDNAPGATGDGYALAMAAGLELMDMEFVQFYPLVYAGSGHAHMILPAPFADIGKIVNRQGEDIKQKYELYEKPVAIVSRDRLSQAMFREIADGNGVYGTVLLDLRGADFTTFPHGELIKNMFRKKTPIDDEPLKVIPACHHTMGGIKIEKEGQTAIEGLFAAGEVVGGIHGANRMGGNALCEALVFGESAAGAASAYAESYGKITYSRRLFETAISPHRAGMDLQAKPSSELRNLMKRLKKLLWEKVGIIRNDASLKKGLSEIVNIRGELLKQRPVCPQVYHKFLECSYATTSAMAIAISALERTETRGSHFREDFPTENSDWEKHIQVKMINNEPRIHRIC